MSKEKYENFSRQIILIFALFLFSSGIKSEATSSIKGQLNIDTTWTPKAYLSVIPTFEQINSMSNQMIIESADINKFGHFSFNTDYLPSEDFLYRIHLSKKNDPPASLIIGGKDENHMFLVANNRSEISIIANDTATLFGNIDIQNSVQNKLMQEINKMVLYVDTANFNVSVLKRDLMEKALDEKFRQFADTCTFPLVALYAIYQTDFESDIKENYIWYSQFLEKWEKNNSPYFEEFRKKIPHKNEKRKNSVFYALFGLVAGAMFTAIFLKFKTKRKLNPIQDLTIQERKIFNLLQSGKSNKEISEEMNISLSTVKSHVNSIFSKLNIKSRKQVIKFETSS